jgi:DNA-binding transcriptional MerR regulator
MTVVRLVPMTEDLLENAAPQLPDKMYFRVGETSRLVGVPAYVLRFWETEFRAVSPQKSGRGHRLYRRKDVELLLQIKHLLYEKRFTLEGARQALKSKPKPAARKRATEPSQPALFAAPAGTLEDIRKELAAILELLR